jgi:hypothetical protein
VLVADDKMPAFTGEQLCRVLLERNARFPILVDSPWKPTEGWVKELAGRGLNVSLLPSPRDPERILRTIENALNINASESKS